MAPSTKAAKSQYAEMSAAKKAITTLFEAAKRGDIATIQQAKGDLAAYKDGHGKHCLHFAAVSGSESCVGAVAAMAPSLVNLADEDGVAPLAFAASRCLLGCCEALLKCGADAKAVDGQGATALHRAASPVCDVAGGRSAIDAGRLVAALVAAGGDPGAQTKSSGAPLHWAAGCDDEAAMPLACAAARALIRAGADVDAADARGLNAIILAGATGNVRAVELLADAGADCGVIVGGGATVVHMIADRGDAEALESLIESGKNGVEAARNVDADGRTAAACAASEGHDACARLLAEATGEDLAALLAAANAEREAEAAEAAKAAAAAPAVTKKAAAATAEDKARAAALKNEGNRALVAGDHAAAVAKYTEALALDDGDKAFFSNRATARLALFEASKDADLARGALADADAAVALDGAWTKAHYRRGTALMALDDYEEAATAFFDALKLDENNEGLKKALQDCVAQGRARAQQAK